MGKSSAQILRTGPAGLAAACWLPLVVSLSGGILISNALFADPTLTPSPGALMTEGESAFLLGFGGLSLEKA